MISRGFKVGDVVDGRIVELEEFGALVELCPGEEGFLHAAEYANWINIAKGDRVRVRIVRISDEGAIKLTRSP
ncbi:MAG: S1 RNA-binding domain-containing protein [Planctomycetes bacterium]|nr:S1 RNA-binding domain-containing protein [Planctomycetota bacterium]MBI3847799.1 S1 RNA-binding domain-containing protein [Planctomycetota bacterium]